MRLIGVRLRGAALALALVVPTAACVLAGGPTRVDQGQAYVTGNADYDAFLNEVVDAAEASKKASGRERASTAALAEALGLTPDAGAGAVAAALAERARKLQAWGTLLHLDLLPDVRLIRAGTGEIDERTQKMLTLVERRVKESLETAQSAGALPDRLARLERKRAELADGAKHAFAATKTATLREIQRELDASKGVIARIAADSAKVAGDASRAALDLARAIETGAEAAVEAEAKAEAAARNKPKWRPPAKLATATAKPPAAPPSAGAQPAPPRPAVMPPTTPFKPVSPPAKPVNTPVRSDDFDP